MLQLTEYFDVIRFLMYIALSPYPVVDSLYPSILHVFVLFTYKTPDFINLSKPHIE